MGRRYMADERRKQKSSLCNRNFKRRANGLFEIFYRGIKQKVRTLGPG